MKEESKLTPVKGEVTQKMNAKMFEVADISRFE